MERQRIYVAGHTGMVGSAVVRRLRQDAAVEILTASHAELDLRDAHAVRAFLERTAPQVVVVAAAKVGGIHANNTYPADFAYDNLAIALNMVHESHRCGVPRLLFLGSSCIYPRQAPQPIPEEALLSSPLEQTNEAYAIAKIAGLKLCQYYRRQFGVAYQSLMPCNLYGPGDNYHPENSHVLPALIRRFSEAAAAGLDEVVVWGTGTVLREFLHVDDLASAIVHTLSSPPEADWLNVGSGAEVTIRDLALLVARATGFRGAVRFDATKPDGTPRKVLDSRRILATGWQPAITLEDGIRRTVEDFRREQHDGALRQ
ncbi:MAG: GDP-L-fucose synthase [Lentisphaerae bacterium]|nr:GDP-L-fucose synthase [Lentisphaerota bacterium]